MNLLQCIICHGGYWEGADCEPHHPHLVKERETRHDPNSTPGSYFPVQYVLIGSCEVCGEPTELGFRAKTTGFYAQELCIECRQYKNFMGYHAKNGKCKLCHKKIRNNYSSYCEDHKDSAHTTIFDTTPLRPQKQLQPRLQTTKNNAPTLRTHPWKIS